MRLSVFAALLAWLGMYFCQQDDTILAGINAGIGASLVNETIKDQVIHLLNKTTVIPYMNFTVKSYLVELFNTTLPPLEFDVDNTGMQMDATNNVVEYNIQDFETKVTGGFHVDGPLVHTTGDMLITIVANMDVKIQYSKDQDRYSKNGLMGAQVTANIDYKKFDIKLSGGKVIDKILQAILKSFEDTIQDKIHDIMQAILQMAVNASYQPAIANSTVNLTGNPFAMGTLAYLGLNMTLAQDFLVTADNFLIYRPSAYYIISPDTQPPLKPQPPVPQYANTTDKNFICFLGENTLDSLFWALSNQNIFGIKLNNDNIGADILDTSTFEFIFPGLTSYYQDKYSQDLPLELQITNNAQNTPPTVTFASAQGGSITFLYETDMAFVVTLPDKTTQEAFRIRFDIEAALSAGFQALNISVQVLTIAVSNGQVVDTIVGDIPIQDFLDEINGLMSMQIDTINNFLVNHTFGFKSIRDGQIVLYDGYFLVAGQIQENSTSIIQEFTELPNRFFDFINEQSKSFLPARDLTFERESIEIAEEESIDFELDQVDE